MYRRILILSVSLILSACSYLSLHKTEIVQGNLINDAHLAQLHPGMTRAEVTQIMGKPLLKNILTPHRSEYVYTVQKGNQQRTQKTISLIFKNGRLLAVH